ncbi:sensor histidine kinase [Pseudomonas sp. GD03858]|uniref:sensor histidine kinase n=1 Tax=unclassified Pseudomonas TaxID=196821 RepID=UPI00244A2094|nr:MULTISPECIES: sensor histidine kinase [unclassified Pseudomonas]MDH0650068.1 sensor histidine kinase [Pseudomonas sp. GD03867]MDH0663952.1 sensor histidine kinase [Pseudomonas sp. GD03858]
MRLPDRHSLFWTLLGGIALLSLLIISLHVDVSQRLDMATSTLGEAARKELSEYGRQAEQAWEEDGEGGVDRFLASLTAGEGVWAVVVGPHDRSLSSRPLRGRERKKLHFIRSLDWSVGRPGGTPTFYVPFARSDAQLVMDLPARLNPRKYNHLWRALLERVLPAGLALGLGVLLFRRVIAPLAVLRRQAIALSAGDLSARVGGQLTRRRDELGELAGAFDHMAGRLENTVAFQRQLLRDLSHELRTPLSRLRVTGEREQDNDALRQRLEREVQGMERLINDTLELVWLDTERPLLPLAPVDVGRLWEVLCEDVCYERGWPVEQLRNALPAGCTVLGHLNSLAQALENLLRNAVRHSPPGGVVTLGGRCEGQTWQVWIEDQGPGVDPEQLESIFQPFTRLNAARPGGDGFGLGLSIARSVTQLQGGEVWAQNREPGLRVTLRLRSV